MREFELPSTGGQVLHCGLWAPKTLQPSAIVQLVHGIAEHIGRYDEFGCFLSEHGFLMVADDHMGHGKSMGEVPGFFPCGWNGAVDDEKILMDRVREEYPKTPYFFLGHSMGSFLTRTFLYRHAKAGLQGAILSGTGWQNPFALRMGLCLCAKEEKKYGEKEISAALNKMVFGSYNRHFRPNRTENDWICTDPAVVDAYNADPLCGLPATIGLARDMLQGIAMNQSKENLLKMPKELPILFFAGKSDPVGRMGKGVERSAQAFQQAGMREVQCKLYPGRHEMLNEPNRQEVYDDVVHWLRAHL